MIETCQVQHDAAGILCRVPVAAAEAARDDAAAGGLMQLLDDVFRTLDVHDVGHGRSGASPAREGAACCHDTVTIVRR